MKIFQEIFIKEFSVNSIHKPALKCIKKLKHTGNKIKIKLYQRMLIFLKIIKKMMRKILKM